MIEILLAAERALSFGMLDQAERLYRQSSEADPRNSIAVVGLARVALERGDEALALAEAERALVIDPENEAARRMVDRLREVRLHRETVAEQAGTPGAVIVTPEPEPEVVTPEPEPEAAAPEPEPEVVTPEPEPEVVTPEAEPEPAVGTPEPERPAPEPSRRGRILAWLRRLFGQR